MNGLIGSDRDHRTHHAFADVHPNPPSDSEPYSATGQAYVTVPPLASPVSQNPRILA